MLSVRIGTSGWLYKDWARTFYPPDTGRSGHLEFYAREFDTVEINATFYRLPSPEIVRGWRDKAPPGFVFAVKGSRFITHMKRLLVERESIAIFFERAKLLGTRLGPILWQLPPNLQYDPERLEKFLRVVPKRYTHAVEFRHPSWYEHDETFDILRERSIAHVCVSSGAMPRNLTVTAPLTYIRFHGLADGARHDYTKRELAPWVRHCRSCLDQGISVYAYFNNDLNTRAPKNAMTFRELVGVAKADADAPARKRAVG
jgi:uncharacterized protein YecE (DUF72 family)